MIEAQVGQGFRIPHGPIMQFYNGIKDITLLYPKLRSIQDKVNEEERVFSCTITITESLSSSDETEIRGAILDVIQHTIVQTLPQGFRSTSSDITFVVHQDATGIIKQTTSKPRGVIGMLLDLSAKNGGLGLGFILDSMSDHGSIRHFLMPKMPLGVESGSDCDDSRMTSASVQLDRQQPLQVKEGLIQLCQKVQERFAVTIRYTTAGGTVFFSIYGATPRDQNDIIANLSQNLPKGFELVINPNVSFSFKTLSALEIETGQ